MFHIQRIRRGVFITLLLALAGAAAPAQAAEPLTLYLLKLMRDQMISSAVESAVNQSPPVAGPPPVAALNGVHGVSAEQLRGLIDTGFVHLTPAQRDEVYADLTRRLADPQHALARPMIIEQLARKAAAVRAAHERLTVLTPAEKRVVAAEAGAEYERLPAAERAQLLQLLRSRVVPIPRDLNDLILVEFSAVQTVADASPATGPQ